MNLVSEEIIIFADENVIRLVYADPAYMTLWREISCKSQC